MKKIVLLSLVFSFTQLFSQQNNQVINTDYLSKVDRGNVIITKNPNIKGSPFLFKVWNSGMLVLNDSVFSKQDYLKYDAYKDELFIKNKGEIIEILDNDVTGFSVLDYNKKLKHYFVKLLSNNFKEKGKDGFYEIVSNLQNTNYLIKKDGKIIYDPNRSKGSQTINNYPLEFRDAITYYIKNDKGLYVKVRLNKRDIKAVLNKHNKLVNNFIKTNRIKFSKERDIVRLANYYYSL
ncbi:hypothetical protein [Lutibacter sp.]|uniref:hypothetical protein n=1 Tax=Lutibacter sp. TaxID=1925666 RepID=UPI0025C4346F|nr:hypothetical protein [Lutibacter sp.]MCF6180787.1 hypothetical protein [Lutibacter sp.]